MTRELILLHAARYPLMEPQDAVKLIYQGAYAGGHAIASPEAAARYLEREWAETEAGSDMPLLEPVAGSLCRINLAAAKARGVEPARVLAAFVDTASQHTPDDAAFARGLELLKTLTSEGEMPFDTRRLFRYLILYQDAGCPAVHHSEAYRRAYLPHYRVIDAKGWKD